MHLNRLAIPALALLLGALSPNFVRAAANPAEPAIAFGQERPWDMPPNEFNDIQRQGFRDGIEGARRDWENHRPPNVENRDEYRNPNMPREQAEAYRDGFRRGYQAGVARFYNNQAMPAAPPQPPAWDMLPNEFNEIQRQGFRDGIEGARRDRENHRPPNVENRDEYRNPNMPREQAEAYREGFRRGYQVGVSHFYGDEAAPAPPPPPPAWDMPPNEFNEIQRQGFHDGMVGAQRDFGNHRNPNPNNRDEYRHPNQPPELRQAYRDGFQRGYWRTMNHLMGRPFEY